MSQIPVDQGSQLHRQVPKPSDLYGDPGLD